MGKGRYVHSRCKWFSKDEPGGCTTFTISTGLACRRGRPLDRATYPQGRRESLCNTFTMQLRTSVRTPWSNDARTPVKPVIVINRSNTVSRLRRIIRVYLSSTARDRLCLTVQRLSARSDERIWWHNREDKHREFVLTWRERKKEERLGTSERPETLYRELAAFETELEIEANYLLENVSGPIL